MGRKRELDYGKINELYQQGMTKKEIADHLHLKYSSVHTALRHIHNNLPDQHPIFVTIKWYDERQNVPTLGKKITTTYRFTNLKNACVKDIIDVLSKHGLDIPETILEIQTPVLNDWRFEQHDFEYIRIRTGGHYTNTSIYFSLTKPETSPQRPKKLLLLLLAQCAHISFSDTYIHHLSRRNYYKTINSS